MSGHSKWATTKHHKAIKDKKKSKILTKYAKLIMVAVREKGSDSETNPSLKALVYKAKKEGVPNENIDRAIKAGAGTLKDAAEIKEVVYECYGPEGVALYVEALTDNQNRTLGHLKTNLNKHGGSLGKSGSVSYLFQRKGVFLFPKSMKDQVEEFSIMNGADDIEETEEHVIVYTKFEDFDTLSRALDDAKIISETEELQFIPLMEKEVSNAEVFQKVQHLIELIEDDDDIQNVFTNASLNES